MEFPVASKVVVFQIEGLEGNWSRAKYTESSKRPDSVRALVGSTIGWFVPFVHEVKIVEEENLELELELELESELDPKTEEEAIDDEQVISQDKTS